jgi:hypothetical protein
MLPKLKFAYKKRLGVNGSGAQSSTVLYYKAFLTKQSTVLLDFKDIFSHFLGPLPQSGIFTNMQFCLIHIRSISMMETRFFCVWRTIYLADITATWHMQPGRELLILHPSAV